MAGNTRGKLKEQFEGVHRNFEWQKVHLTNALVLIDKHKPSLSEACKLLAEQIIILDELAQGIYAKL